MVKCPQCNKPALKSCCHILENHYYKTYLDHFKCYQCDISWSPTYDYLTRVWLLKNQLQTASFNGFNHNQPLSYFKDDISIIQAAGFNLIAVTIMLLENTFVFNTKEEAEQAYNLLERDNGLVQGWWYGLEDFKKAEQDYDSKLLVYYLN